MRLIGTGSRPEPPVAAGVQAAAAQAAAAEAAAMQAAGAEAAEAAGTVEAAVTAILHRIIGRRLYCRLARFNRREIDQFSSSSPPSLNLPTSHPPSHSPAPLPQLILNKNIPFKTKICTSIHQIGLEKKINK